MFQHFFRVFKPYRRLQRRRPHLIIGLRRSGAHRVRVGVVQGYEQRLTMEHNEPQTRADMPSSPERGIV